MNFGLSQVFECVFLVKRQGVTLKKKGRPFPVAPFERGMSQTQPQAARGVATGKSISGSVTWLK